MVVDAEGSGGGVGLHAGDGGVALVIDDAVEADVAVFHDDVDGVKAERRIVGDASGHAGDAEAATKTALIRVVHAQGGGGVDAVIDGGADAVVVGRVG